MKGAASTGTLRSDGSEDVIVVFAVAALFDVEDDSFSSSSMISILVWSFDGFIAAPSSQNGASRFVDDSATLETRF